jgi:hypothetical protein
VCGVVLTEEFSRGLFAPRHSTVESWATMDTPAVHIRHLLVAHCVSLSSVLRICKAKPSFIVIRLANRKHAYRRTGTYYVRTEFDSCGPAACIKVRNINQPIKPKHTDFELEPCRLASPFRLNFP